MPYLLAFRPNAVVNVVDSAGGLVAADVPCQLLKPFIGMDPDFPNPLTRNKPGSWLLRLVLQTAAAVVGYWPNHDAAAMYSIVFSVGGADERAYQVLDTFVWDADVVLGIPRYVVCVLMSDDRV